MDPHGHCGGFDAGESYFPLSRLALPLLQAYDLFTALEANASFNRVEALRNRGPDEADIVTFYMMGPGEEATVGNYWTTLPDFPTPTYTPYYLQPDNTLKLVPTTNTSSEFTYRYDPANPVPNKVCGREKAGRREKASGRVRRVRRVWRMWRVWRAGRRV